MRKLIAIEQDYPNTILDISKPRNADLLENPLFGVLMRMVAEGKEFTPEYRELYEKYDSRRKL